MDIIGRDEAIRRMNAMGGEARPFLFVVDYEGSQAIVCPLADVDAAECLYDFRGRTNFPPPGPAAGASTSRPSPAGARPSPTPTSRPSPTAPQPSRPIRWDIRPPRPERYRRQFETVRRAILRGDSYLTNLSCRIPLMTDQPLPRLFALAHAPYRLWLRGRLLCFSPETFVRILGNEISTFPMKGTLPANLPGAEARLLADRKEAAEHATVVDLLRNDLSMVATHVSVSRYRYVERIATHRGPLLQTSSEIRGQLPTDWPQRLGDILFTLLPAGSICGAPKPRTLALIREAEGRGRGFYTGIMGYCDGHRLESAVMIRFIEQTPAGRLYYHAGGGITARSQWQSEYDEVIQKAYLPTPSATPARPLGLAPTSP